MAERVYRRMNESSGPFDVFIVMIIDAVVFVLAMVTAVIRRNSALPTRLQLLSFRFVARPFFDEC